MNNVIEQKENPIVVVKDILAFFGGKKAEEALVALAKEENDLAVRKVIDGLSPDELTKILLEHDLSRESIIPGLLEPEEVAKILQAAPMNWKKISAENILSLQEEALTLLTSIILTEEDSSRQGAILDSIAEEEDSFIYFLLPFIGWIPKYFQPVGTEELEEEIEEEEIPIESDESVKTVLEDTEVEPFSVDALFENVRLVRPELAERILTILQEKNEKIPALLQNFQAAYREASEKMLKEGEIEFMKEGGTMFIPLLDEDEDGDEDEEL